MATAMNLSSRHAAISRQVTKASMCPPRAQSAGIAARRSLLAGLSVSRVFQAAPVQRRTVQQVVKAETKTTLREGVSGDNDYTHVLAVAGFVAHWYSKFSVDRAKMLQAFAFLSLFTSAVNLLTRKGAGDQISTYVGPAVMAVAILNFSHVTYLDTATLLFGYFLSETLGGLFGAPYYLFFASLVGALYFGYGTLWYVAAFGLAAAGKLYNSNKNKDAIPVLLVPTALACGWAIYKEKHFVMALILYLSQIVWSGTLSLQKLADSS